jgi:flagellar biogenesis protein FliO
MKISHCIAAITLLGALAWGAPSLALEPAGSSPEGVAVAQPQGTTNDDTGGDDTRSNDPDASAEPLPEAVKGAGSSGARSWLARGGSEPPPAARESDNTTAGLTLGAVVLVLGLAGAAIYLRFKRQTALPLTPSESRLTVLSSSRVGPKAYAVTAHVNGRVLLLGVTDHGVTNLGWLDPPEPQALAAVPAADDPENGDELPDDYPGSALRASKAPPVPFATTSELKRFQEVLRGVAARSELPLRPSYPARPVPDAASTLAAQTTDIVAAALPAAMQISTSLRRKRRSGRESDAPREPRAATVSRAPKADPFLERQVAGLHALRNGG